MNLDDKLKLFPECKNILHKAHKNAIKDATGRKHGELTRKELESFFIATIKQALELAVKSFPSHEHPEIAKSIMNVIDEIE